MKAGDDELGNEERTGGAGVGGFVGEVTFDGGLVELVVGVADGGAHHSPETNAESEQCAWNDRRVH